MNKLYGRTPEDIENYEKGPYKSGKTKFPLLVDDVYNIKRTYSSLSYRSMKEHTGLLFKNIT